MCEDFQLKDGQSAVIFADTHVLPPLIGGGSRSFWEKQLEPIRRVVQSAGPQDIVCAAGDLFEAENTLIRNRLRASFIGEVGGILQARRSFFLKGNHDFEENIPGVQTVQHLRLSGEGVFRDFDVMVTHGDRLDQLPCITYPPGTKMYTEEMYRTQRARVEKNPLLPYAGQLLSAFGWVVDGGRDQDWIKTNAMLNTARMDPARPWKYLLQGHIHPMHNFSVVQLDNSWINRAVVGKSIPQSVEVIRLTNDNGTWRFTRQSSTDDGWMYNDITPQSNGSQA